MNNLLICLLLIVILIIILVNFRKNIKESFSEETVTLTWDDAQKKCLCETPRGP